MEEFELEKRYGENAFGVDLPSHWKLARTFNISIIKSFTINYS
jgi:hypothetical protein